MGGIHRTIQALRALERHSTTWLKTCPLRTTLFSGTSGWIGTLARRTVRSPAIVTTTHATHLHLPWGSSWTEQQAFPEAGSTTYRKTSCSAKPTFSLRILS